MLATLGIEGLAIKALHQGDPPLVPHTTHIWGVSASPNPPFSCQSCSVPHRCQGMLGCQCPCAQSAVP